LPNLALFTQGFFVRDGAGARAAKDYIQRLRIKAQGPDASARGGWVHLWKVRDGKIG